MKISSKWQLIRSNEASWILNAEEAVTVARIGEQCWPSKYNEVGHEYCLADAKIYGYFRLGRHSFKEKEVWWCLVRKIGWWLIVENLKIFLLSFCEL